MKFSLNSHRGLEQLDIRCILDQLESNRVDCMLANASGEHPVFCSMWRCGFASGISGERHRTACSLLCGTTGQFFSQSLRSEQQCITGVMSDAPWIVLSRKGTSRGCSVLQQQFDSKHCKLNTIEPTGKQSSLQHRPNATSEHSKVKWKHCSRMFAGPCSALNAPKLPKVDAISVQSSQGLI